MSDAIGFIGLGQLGLPMATNLVESGYALRIYNRTPSKTAPLAARGVPVAARAVDAITPGGVVITVVWDDDALESVVNSDGFLDRLGPAGLHISMSTVSPAACRRVAAVHAKHGSGYLEAPVFGRPEAAAARKLWIPVAGAQAAKDRGRPILEALGQGVFDFGDAPGAATTVKIAGNFLIFSAARSMTEALVMAQRNGVAPKAVIEMLTTTLFAAPIYQSYGKMLAEQLDGGTTPMAQSPIPQKDIGLFRGLADDVGVPAPIASVLHQLTTQSRSA
jgi:3-hydroxyisobutyrate dehydrogenase-like beta-hydroxyacid dehydrogenase